MNKLLDVYAHVQLRIKIIKTIAAAYDFIMIYIISANVLNQEVLKWNISEKCLIMSGIQWKYPSRTLVLAINTLFCKSLQMLPTATECLRCVMS